MSPTNRFSIDVETGNWLKFFRALKGSKTRSPETWFSSHFNPLTPKVKPWVIQSLLTFDSVRIHWKAVEQYFTAMLFVNPLTPKVKPRVIQSVLTFDPMYRTLKCDYSSESC